jgi:hypothetical protein
MYVDEVGNHDLGPATANPDHRYLSLTGLAMELGYVASYVAPTLEDIKRRYFGSHPDTPVILHRKEIVGAKGPFAALADPDTRERFGREVMDLLRCLECTVITTVIDKQEHKLRYRTWLYDPYHYCLHALLERYVTWLESMQAQGDVMAESRGGKEDHRLKESFRRLCAEGTDYVAAGHFAAALTSGQLKVRPKPANVAGLQLADLIAHPSFRSMVARRTSTAMTAPFGREIAEVLWQSKYRRSPEGRVDGWGCKWLP